MTLQPLSLSQQIDYRKHKNAEARRKRTQAMLSGAGALAGAAGVGLVATGKLKHNPKLVEHGFTAGSVGGGIGAVSGATFARNQLKEAAEAREEARKPMNNSYKVKKSLAEIAKAYKSVAVEEDTPAWRRARPKGKEDWRQHVSQGARHAYDYPLAPSREKRDVRYAAGRGIQGAGLFGGVTGGLLAGSPKIKALSLGTGATAFYAGHRVHRKGDEYDKASRKIRARGYQRMLEKEQVEKAFLRPKLPKVPGSFTRSTVVRTPSGGFAIRNPYATRSYGPRRGLR